MRSWPLWNRFFKNDGFGDDEDLDVICVSVEINPTTIVLPPNLIVVFDGCMEMQSESSRGPSTQPRGAPVLRVRLSVVGWTGSF